MPGRVEGRSNTPILLFLSTSTTSTHVLWRSRESIATLGVELYIRRRKTPVNTGTPVSWLLVLKGCYISLFQTTEGRREIGTS